MVAVVVRKLIPERDKHIYQNRLEALRKQLIFHKGFIDLKTTSDGDATEDMQMELQIKLSFDSYAGLKEWENNCTDLLSISLPPETGKARFLKSTQGQGVLKNILTVYPLVLGVDWFLGLFFPMTALPRQAAIFFNLLLVMLLMQYAVIPCIKAVINNRFRRSNLF